MTEPTTPAQMLHSAGFEPCAQATGSGFGDRLDSWRLGPLRVAVRSDRGVQTVEAALEPRSESWYPLADWLQATRSAPRNSESADDPTSELRSFLDQLETVQASARGWRRVRLFFRLEGAATRRERSLLGGAQSGKGS